MKPVKWITRTLILALAAVMLAGAACADAPWSMTTTLEQLAGGPLGESAIQLIQADLYTETVNGVEIKVQKALYDGRTLFLELSYRLPGVDKPLGVTLADFYGDSLPAGLNPAEYTFGLAEGAEDLLYSFNVGWWTDDFWIDGKSIGSMPEGSAMYLSGTDVPGEIIETDVLRLDKASVYLAGKTQVSLPIGNAVNREEYLPDTHPEKYDENGNLLLPETGVVTFEVDAGAAVLAVKKLSPAAETVLPDFTAKVRDAVITPVMTYINVDMAARPEAMAAYIAEHGESELDDEGNVLWAHSAMDVYAEWLNYCVLTDGSGKVLVPDLYGSSSFNDTKAEFLYPILDPVPDELYIAPTDENGVPDMTQAIKITP